MLCCLSVFITPVFRINRTESFNSLNSVHLKLVISNWYYSIEKDFNTFLKYYIPKKHDFLEEAIDFHKEMINLINDSRDLNKIRRLLEENKVYNVYELDINHYLNNRKAGFNSNQLIRDLEFYIKNIESDLEKFDGYLVCINSSEDNFNFNLDGEMIDKDTCPECGEEFYPIGLKNPCPKCGKNTMELSREISD